MLNKKYLPSFGFIILFITIIGSALFINWALGPLSYEKAMEFEQKGHQLVKEGEIKEASKYFLKAAKIDDDNISTSRRYRCAGTTALKEEDKIKYYKLALKYNPNNQNAKKELNAYDQEIRYINRYGDGWSIGKTGKAKINVNKNSNKYKINYFTSNPEKKEFEIKILLDNKIVEQKLVKNGETNSFNFSLQIGLHDLEIQINHTFNPNTLHISTDNRDLGVHYSIEKVRNTNE